MDRGAWAAKAGLALLGMATAACGGGTTVSVDSSVPVLAVSAAQPSGILLFDHDLAGAPELQARVSLVPPEQVAELDRQAGSDEPVQWPTTVAPEAVSSPSLQCGQQYTFTLAPGTYTTALFDRDGNRAGVAFMTRVVAGAVAEPPITVATMWMLTSLEPPGSGATPPPGSPAAALLDVSVITVGVDLVDGVPVRFWIIAAGDGAGGDQAGAVGSDGVLSPMLGPGQTWGTLVPAGDYRVTAWNADGNRVWGEATVSVADRRDPVRQHGGVALSQLLDAPLNNDPTRTPPH